MKKCEVEKLEETIEKLEKSNIKFVDSSVKKNHKLYFLGINAAIDTMRELNLLSMQEIDEKEKK